ncbi:MAG TPA: anti-sigma factor antagonist [Armatimonadetes bacterium]|nr:anti-sigma factor antagonist [Armatimonadota bacterium]
MDGGGGWISEAFGGAFCGEAHLEGEGGGGGGPKRPRGGAESLVQEGGMKGMLDISTREVEDKLAVIKVRGDVDIYTAPQLRETIHKVVDAGRSDVIVDLGGVDFIDSTGLGVLIGGLRRARERGGELVIASPSERVRRILEITDLRRIFRIFKTADEAISALREG